MLTSLSLLKSSKRVLEPMDRISEVLFGLIMVLTFTGSLSVAEAGKDDVRNMLVGALGCNLAWGLIDAVFYLMGCLAEKGRDRHTLRAIQSAPGAGQRQQIVSDALPPLVSSVMQPSELEALQERLRALPAPARPPRLNATEWRGAAAIFLLVFFSTLPVAIPFMLFANAHLAMRVSNGVAILMLLITGAAFGRYIGCRPWAAGLAMVLLGGALVGLTIALGG